MIALPFPVQSLKPFRAAAKRAAYRSSEHGDVRLHPARDRSFTAVDRHPWGEVHWVLTRSRYLTAHRQRDAVDVVRQFQPRYVAVTDPARNTHAVHEATALGRRAFPRGPQEQRAFSIGASLGTVGLTGSITAGAAASLPMPATGVVLGAGIAAAVLGGPAALRMRRRTGIRGTYLATVDRSTGPRRGLWTRRARTRPVAPAYVLDALADAAETWQLLHAQPHHLPDEAELLTGLHEAMFELMRAVPHFVETAGLVEYVEHVHQLCAETTQIAQAYTDDVKMSLGSRTVDQDQPDPDLVPPVDLDSQTLRERTERLRHRRQAINDLAGPPRDEPPT